MSARERPAGGRPGLALPAGVAACPPQPSGHRAHPGKGPWKGCHGVQAKSAQKWKSHQVSRTLRTSRPCSFPATGRSGCPLPPRPGLGVLRLRGTRAAVPSSAPGPINRGQRVAVYGATTALLGPLPWMGEGVVLRDWRTEPGQHLRNGLLPTWTSSLPAPSPLPSTAYPHTCCSVPTTQDIPFRSQTVAHWLGLLCVYFCK